jgi:DNA polymerase-1
MAKKLIIVDISSFIFRAFFAIRPMHAADGTPVNAVYGVMNMVLKLINSYQPTHVILAKDTSGGSFRNEIYPEYKANRGEPPEELIPQFALIRELVEKMELPYLAFEKYEADDIIGSLATQFKKDFDEIFIASGDKDLMQFVDDNVKMLDTMKDIIYDRDKVFDKMGVYPEQVMDYLSLVGDSSDNIPGVKGIGAKGAAGLLAEFKDLDNLIKNIENITTKRSKTALEKGIDDAHLSRSLVKIVTDIELGKKPEELKYDFNPSPDLISFLEQLNFNSMINKLKATPGASKIQSSTVDYIVVKDLKNWAEILEILEGEDQVAVEFFFMNEDYHTENPHLFSLSTFEKNYIIYTDGELNFYDVLENLNNISRLKFVSSNVKPLIHALTSRGKKLNLTLFDLSQAHFVLNPDVKHDLEFISEEYIHQTAPTLKELRKENFEDMISQKKIESGMARRCANALRSYPWAEKKLKEQDLAKVYYEIDLPLQPILANMEQEGIGLDRDFYYKLEKEYSAQNQKILDEIAKHGGGDINLRSPKQVGVLLFETLGLPVIKKTKTGYSTSVDVLEELNRMGESEIPGLILKYRELEKLLSTYIKVFPTLVNEKTKRIHTHFNQNVAATGRLSSEHPNLQNIPIRTDNGRKLRKGFIASPGHVLLAADYSQVELRILAHFSKDPVMVKAFKNDEDIHAQTASEIFDLPLNQIDSSQRSAAKAINFGLMYGQGVFGLSQTLNIPQRDAKEYITNYFTRFSKVKTYLDSLKEKCEQKGHTETMMGRIRHVPDINSTNRQTKSMAERVAINTPIQGTAADIIKLAMLKIDRELLEQGLKSKMLLQVHDELIFEVPNDEIEVMSKLVREVMEGIVDLQVPLKVDMGTGENWYDLK